MALLILLALGILIGLFALGSVKGAPFLPTRPARFDAIFDLFNLEPGDRLLDIGVGSGALLLVAARRGIKGTGYEINPILYLLARHRTRNYRHLVEIKLGNYWKHRLPETDAIYVFLITKYMLPLRHKLEREVIKPTLVVSHGFKMPGKSIERATGDLYLYSFGG